MPDGDVLMNVVSLADQWGTRYWEQGKTVWAERTSQAPKEAPT
ncbi:hypothetical protein [Streptomyces sp. R41]|uniref:HTH hxlR-type domain-containing protein n=1 Tax=Streptomyces sp. R41 TaxID=3238632 RepID=A0AB39R6Q0_9ACTN